VPLDKVEYFLWPSDDLADLWDEFVVRSCRVMLHGDRLVVEALSEKADAVTLATDYAAALRKRFTHFRLLTVQEFCALPARAIEMVGPTARERVNHRAHLREARQAIVAPYHQRLSQCYDYFQSAVEDPEHALFHLYKLLESFEAEYGRSEGSVVTALGPELKTLKRLANEPSNDERHAPTSAGGPKPLIDPYAALDVGRFLLRKFEEAVMRSISR
jgi:hypothetical protein